MFWYDNMEGRIFFTTVNDHNVLTLPVVGVGKEGRTLLSPRGTLTGSSRLSRYLENYCPFAGGFSAMNPIGNAIV